MLPPPPVISLLETNPNFALLYEYLVFNVLNNDGSTRSANIEHENITEGLDAARRSILRDEILLQALEEMATTPVESSKGSEYITNSTSIHFRNESNDGFHVSSDSLSPDLRDLILNIVSYLSVSLDPEASSQLSPDTHDLMTSELETLYSRLPEISHYLSTYLLDTEHNIATLAATLSRSDLIRDAESRSYPRTTLSKHNQNQHSSPPALSESLTTLMSNISLAQTSTLPALLNETTQSLNTLLATRAQQLHCTIRNLELTVHGTNARHLSSRSTYLNSVSRGMELKAHTLRLEKEKSLYATSDDVLDHMAEEYDALQDQDRQLAKRERNLEALLEEYETAGQEAVSRVAGRGAGHQQQLHVGSGEDVFKVLGERYAEIEGELEVVRADIERLEEKWLRPRESRF